MIMVQLDCTVNQGAISDHTVEYRSVLTTHGVQYVIISGMKETPVWFVDNLDIHHMVSCGDFGYIPIQNAIMLYM